jgi:exonuclease V gamma subunit
MDTSLAKSLYRWAYAKPENREQIEAWLETAVAAMAAGKGKEVAATSANGVSVAFQSNSMSVASWFSTLSAALAYLDTRPVSKIAGVVR